jgi:hypothetical protein
VTVAQARNGYAYAAAIWVRRPVAGRAIRVAGAAIASLGLAVRVPAILLIVVVRHVGGARCDGSIDVLEGRRRAVRQVRKRRKDALVVRSKIFRDANVNSDAN